MFLSQKSHIKMKGGVSVGTLHKMVTDARENRRVEESFIEFNDGKAKKAKKVKKDKKALAHQPRIREPFDEKGWNEAYEQACKDLTPEQLEALKYVSPAKSDPSSNAVMTPKEFAAL